jgi:protein-disulfide isomerase
MARVSVVQFGDFECMDCGRAAMMLRSFRHRFEQQMRFTYKHFPQDNMHPHAALAAEAAECARAQGRFWKMHDVLIAHQEQLGLERLYAYAEQAGLDMARFDAEMENEVHLPVVRADLAAGRAFGVVRTPTFLVDGVLVENARGLGALYEATEIAVSA